MNVLVRYRILAAVIPAALATMAAAGCARGCARNGGGVASKESVEDAAASSPWDASQLKAGLTERVRALRAKVYSPRCPPGMIFIPDGKFTMGSVGNESEDEFLVNDPGWETSGERNDTPPHPMTVRAFCMDVTPVTASEYIACVGAGRCRELGPDDEDGERFCTGTGQVRSEHPVTCVDWTSAESYCALRGARLPSEAEWEFAARGTDSRFLPYGAKNPKPDTCWPQQGDNTCPVGMFAGAASPFGVLDISDATTEWTASAYCDYPQHDCVAPLKAVRGAYAPAAFRTTTSRRPRAPSVRDAGITFRCVQEPT
jgi:formylglycine-generating enzyme required for sulfatase activity